MGRYVPLAIDREGTNHPHATPHFAVVVSVVCVLFLDFEQKLNKSGHFERSYLMS